MDKKDTKILDKRETLFVAAIAKAIAVANGHSHPDDWAAAVSAAYASPEEEGGATSDLHQSIDESRADARASREK